MEGFFPCSSHQRRQTASQCGLFRANQLRRISVDVRRAHLHPHRRRRIDTTQRLAQDTCRLDPRPKDLVLVVRRFDAVDAAAGKVDQPGGVVQLVSPRPQRPPVPRPMPPRTGGLWCSARENHQRSAAVAEVMGEGRRQEIRCRRRSRSFCVREN